MVEKFDTDYTDNIVCPYCGYEESDSLEHTWDYDDEYECENCGKTFSWERNVLVSYTSFKAEGDSE